MIKNEFCASDSTVGILALGLSSLSSRSRFEAKYDLGTKVTPYISVELRYQLSAPRQVESDGTWHRIRYAGGINYELNKRNTLGAYYLIQNEFNVSSPQNQYIIGLEYSISL